MFELLLSWLYPPEVFVAVDVEYRQYVVAISQDDPATLNAGFDPVRELVNPAFSLTPAPVCTVGFGNQFTFVCG